MSTAFGTYDIRYGDINYLTVIQPNFIDGAVAQITNIINLALGAVIL